MLLCQPTPRRSRVVDHLLAEVHDGVLLPVQDRRSRSDVESDRTPALDLEGEREGLEPLFFTEPIVQSGEPSSALLRLFIFREDRDPR